MAGSYKWSVQGPFKAQILGSSPIPVTKGVCQNSPYQKLTIIAATSGAAEPKTSTVQGVLLEKEIAMTRGTGPVCSDSAVRCERVRN